MENIKVDEYKRLSIEIQNVFITFVISQQYLKNKMVQNTNAVKRLVSLDVLRGLTVMFMIFVNNGAGEEIFSTLQHSKWNGMTPCDLVFPFFLFIMGISTYLSLRKGGFRWTHQQARKTVKRTLLLFLIGLLINWFDMAMDGRPLDFAHLRIMGVMQRIAICYLLWSHRSRCSHHPSPNPFLPWTVGARSSVVDGLFRRAACWWRL